MTLRAKLGLTKPQSGRMRFIQKCIRGDLATNGPNYQWIIDKIGRRYPGGLFGLTELQFPDLPSPLGHAVCSRSLLTCSLEPMTPNSLVLDLGQMVPDDQRLPAISLGIKLLPPHHLEMGLPVVVSGDVCLWQISRLPTNKVRLLVHRVMAFVLPQ
jgi:hypothetical protein